MSEIQDEAYTEALDEISRLRARIENMMKNQAEGLRIRDAEIERLNRDKAFMASNDYVHSLTSLITRAADALERAPVLPPKMIEALIAELRKAAE
jgi:hypothetical protein